MKSILIKLSLLLSFFAIIHTSNVNGQYANEWINYSNTYYKFKIAKDGIYRISQSVLASAGLTGFTGAQLTIYRNGAKIPIFVSTSGTFAGSDFVEFYGQKSDGNFDKQLYSNPNWHPSDKYSLFTDTASYYLTIASGAHPRMNNTAFTLPSTLPSPEPYMMTEITTNNGYKPGTHRVGVTYSTTHSVLKSSFDRGEGFLVSTIATGGIANNNLNLTKLYTSSAVSSFVNIAYSSATYTTAYPKFHANSTLLKDTTLFSYGVIKRKFPISSSLLTSTTNIKATSLVPGSSTIVAGGFNAVTIEYPRTFSYSGLSDNFTRFYLAASSLSKYLNFTDLSITGEQAILYDIVNNRRFEGVNGSSNSQFYIPPSTTSLDFVFQMSNGITEISTLETINFKNYNTAVNQGNYIILSHKGYISHESNPVGNYAAYRRSAPGGSHNAIVVDVTELYDQFGYGLDYHPMAVKNFLKYANDTWAANKPEHVFIIGKGLLYNGYKAFQDAPSTYAYNFVVPTYGNPGSDNLFTDFNNDNVPEIAIGRLSAWNVPEISNYLDKVKAYEAELNSGGIANLENTIWKKSALQIAGSTLADQNNFINPTFNACTNIFTDSLVGGFVTNIKKSTSGLVPIETDDQIIKNKLLSGVNRLSFYGHAFSTGFDYNLNNPDELISTPRFPNFIAMGCNVSQIFEKGHTIGEDFINSINGGSISMIASNTFGYPSVLDPYLRNFYRNISYLNFGKTVGIQYTKNIETMSGITSSDLAIIHLQNIIFQGDPGLATYSPDKPDYYTNNDLITSSVNPIHTGIDSVTISTVVYNLGSTTSEKVKITIEHQKPNGTTVYYADTISKKLNNIDTFKFKIGFDNTVDIGMNKIIVRVNPEQIISELSYAQNIAEINLFMSADVAIPIYPHEFAIVHQTPLVLKASALNLLTPNQNFILQIDTTEKFNSAFKKEQKFNNILGGVITWNPPITMVDSQVYYWRTTTGITATDTSLWFNSSFIYLEDGFDGWNQSHYFQFDKNKPFTNLSLEDTQRNFKFGLIENEVLVYNRIYSPENPNPLEVRTLINNEEVDKMGCTNTAASIKFIVIDPMTALPMANSGAKYGSIARCIAPALNRNSKQFEFHTNTSALRKRAADFIDSIPEGHFVIVSNLVWTTGGRVWNINNAVQNWTADVGLYGEENTLYYKLKQLGFDQLDSFNRKRVFTFVTKKNDPSFENITKFSNEDEELITVDFSIFTKAKFGSMRSARIGPASNWETALWNFNTPGGLPLNDTNLVKIFGVKPDLTRELLYTSSSNTINLADINPINFPYIDMEWHTQDSINQSASNLRYWRVLYTPIPEGGLNPNRHLVKAVDTIHEGEKVNFEMAFDNLTHIPFGDSILVHYRITKADGTTAFLKAEKIKKLSGFDSTIAKLSFDPRNFPGKNTVFIEVNPDNNQPEQFHPNNIGYFTFYLQKDSTNPVLDVTFDGVHILDRDIVSAKPLIKILLKDENLNIPLADTSLLKLQLLRPGTTTPEDIIIDGNIAKFIPSTSSDKNEASIDYTPTFVKDGLYKLIVYGKDNTGNNAGSTAKYEIQFMVETKPSITNLLNYPNPFSTSTAFVFTLTGSQVPEQFKIQILTVTGKVVKEITKQELGSIRIGRNITDYKWDGKDQYGQLLGNGVYIYRLVTRLNGTAVEHRENKEIDQFFNKDGYGKMYIMR